MKKISEVIVVEGRNDTSVLKQYFLCDTIETHGTCLSEFTLNLIRSAQKKRGVIILTDPDSPGNRIRHEINQKVPGCLNAYIDKDKAKTDKKVGVEHADREAIEEALMNLVTYRSDEETFTMNDMYKYGLAGRQDSAKLREKAGRILHIGTCSAKTFRARLNSLLTTKEELKEVLEKCQNS
ncbi:MAG: ribonuclease M5 [Solobacterium sp.]|nr:ribonuclease M5 [Solobacterium sp.]